jgi:hypothetical protein
MGRDATVFWGLIDLKLENTLTYPVLILASAEGGRLTIRVLGYHADDRDVEILQGPVETIAYKTFEKPDPQLEAGKRVVEKKGRRGFRVTTTRVVRKDGQEVRREVLAHNLYRPYAEVVRVGTKPQADAGEAAPPPAAGRAAPPPPPAASPVPAG